MGFIDSLRAKYELYRLEQRYTRRDKRTTFVSSAQYVDGEYVYNSVAASPTSTSSSSWASSKNNRASVRVREMVFKTGRT
ncbi:hypothetical protein H2203_004016 [Taxawa tesnikishii (nom. ined.)]|nr:hypothetical protein H2203_004016 [Dothideales sp. JES 119]